MGWKIEKGQGDEKLNEDIFEYGRLSASGIFMQRNSFSREPNI